MALVPDIKVCWSVRALSWSTFGSKGGSVGFSGLPENSCAQKLFPVSSQNIDTCSYRYPVGSTHEAQGVHIPLCRLVAIPMVRPTLACDITKLEQEFAGGYRDGTAVFYVSTTNEEGQSEEFSDEEMSKWDRIWREKNKVFTRYLDSRRQLNFLKNLKFFICDGNHRRLAWMNVIDRCYTSFPKWHFLVDCILLERKGRTELVMQVMYDINK